MVYGDILFLVDFSMDFLTFYLVARIGGRRLNIPRTAAASALGAVYSVAALAFDTAPLGFRGRILRFCADALALVAICAAALWRRGTSPRTFAVSLGAFCAVGSLLGGVMTALCSLLGRLPLAEGQEPEADGISVWFFAAAAAVGSLAAVFWDRHRRTEAQSVTVRIRRGGREVSLNAICDTGNFLRDPASGRAVMICELGAVEALFPPPLCRMWQSQAAYFRAQDLPAELAAEVRFIPAHSPTGGDTLLCAVGVDEISIENGGKTSETVENLLLAPVARRIGQGEARAIFPACALPGAS